MTQNTQKHLPQFATFTQRLQAYAIDCLIFLPLVLAKAYNMLEWKSFGLMVASSVIWMFYKTFMEFRYGATFGKRFSGIRVVNEKFESITYSQSVGRFIFYFGIELGSLLAFYGLFQNPEFLNTTDPILIQQMQLEMNTTASGIAQFLYIFAVCAIFTNPLRQSTYDKISGSYCISVK